MEFMVVGLAIIHKNGNVLIGNRKEKDKFVEHLTWVFPGGKLESLDFEREIKEIAKRETGLDIDVKRIIAARIMPESSINAVIVYFECTGKGIERAGGGLKELKWVPATSVCNYFTTSVMTEIMDFLKNIENNKM
ncbi:MAG: NUDIX hydrolase [Candidatus Aenigmatarchaeota archaeon]